MPEVSKEARGATPSPFISLSTDALPERDRTAMFCDLYARQMLRVEAEPLKGHPFHVDLKIRKLPGLDFIAAENSPLRVSRTKEMLSDGNDSVLVNIATDGIVVNQLGREATLARGDAVASSTADAASIAVPATGKFLSLFIPRSVPALLLREPEACFMRPIPKGSPALRLLLDYLGLLARDSEMTPELEVLAVTHIYDLLALTLGATRDAAAVAAGRGVRAAHLRAIKNQIIRSLHRDISASTIAAEQRLTTRYVRKLFEGEGTSPTEFICEQRLAIAHRMLVDRHFDGLRILDIALHAGFNNVSYFNRVFRRRYGLSPGEARERSIVG